MRAQRRTIDADLTIAEEEMMRKLALAAAAVVVSTSLAWADDIRAVMEQANKRWLDAFNTPNVSAFPPQYTDDAVLIPQEAMGPIKGPQAIAEWWEGGIKGGFKNHTFQVLEAKEFGNMAYQLSSWTVDQVKDGKTTPFAGHTMRIYERQSDGTWKTKIHMYRYPPTPANKQAEK
jgi:ketosteroid isomerase-like protein